MTPPIKLRYTRLGGPRRDSASSPIGPLPGKFRSILPMLEEVTPSLKNLTLTPPLVFPIPSNLWVTPRPNSKYHFNLWKRESGM
jgi:hypothetical protein